MPSNQAAPLQKLLWRSFVRTALIPLLVIELGFLATYWISETIVYEKNVEAISGLSERYFLDIANREAATISASLESIASHTRVFAHQTLAALEGDYVPPQSERDRYTIRESGGLHTYRDNGTTSSFYASRTIIGPNEINKIWRLSAVDPLMMAIKGSNANIASIYFNTFDSYNRIYPYIDIDQYSDDMDIPSYNFYYEADGENNPLRRDVWTDAYVDPAGHGWMVSSIAPVWSQEKLEGVVGIDVTLETIIGSLLDLNLPWGGYAILVDENGGIIALPPAGEPDFGLNELTEHQYSEAILNDTFKPEAFNINLRDDTKPLAEAMASVPSGEVSLELDGLRLASFAIVPQTGWRLVIIAPQDRIFADALALHEKLKSVGYVMLGALLSFYLVFFAFLLRRARAMSAMIAQPLSEISTLIDNIDGRENVPQFDGSEVAELNNLGNRLLATRERLHEAEDETRLQSRIAKKALMQLREANGEMVSFTRLISHQIRTPLSVVDGSAQIIQRKAEVFDPPELRKRATRLRNSVAAIDAMLSKLVNRFDSIALELANEGNKGTRNIRDELAELASEIVPANRLHIHLPEHGPFDINAPGGLAHAIKEVLSNAVRHSTPYGQIEVTLEANSPDAIVTITNDETEENGMEQIDSGDRSRSGTKSTYGQVIGIGLHMARRAVEDCGGSLRMKSSEGKTTVTIIFPLSTKTS